MTRELRREPGLYKNGNRWWLRVRSPDASPFDRVRPVSTGFTDLTMANRVAIMVREMREQPAMREWLVAVVQGALDLKTLYEARAAGRLNDLRDTREQKSAELADTNLEPFASRWLREVIAGREIGEGQRRDYTNQIRALIPEDERFPRSRFTEDYVRGQLNILTTNHGTPASGSTKRAYLNTWQQWYRWARKRAGIEVNPFEDIEEQDKPRRNPSRMTFWEFTTVQQVLGKLPEGDLRNAAGLIFGAGVELGAVLSMQARHVIGGEDRRLMVPGSKTENRVDRTAFGDAWAWQMIESQARDKRPMQPLFDPEIMGYKGRLFRQALYQAQIDADLIPAPPVNPKTRKPLWGKVAKHDVHDARHTYAMIRLLGLDGAPRQSFKYVANNLGHADEQMVMRVYSKARGEERLRLIELREARAEGRATEVAAQQGITLVKGA